MTFTQLFPALDPMQKIACEPFRQFPAVVETPVRDNGYYVDHVGREHLLAAERPDPGPGDPTLNILTPAERREFYRNHPRGFTPSPNPPGFTFWLGCPTPAWLGRSNVPMFVSLRRLLDPRKAADGDVQLVPKASYHRARGPWAMDSGGFSFVKDFGCYPVEPPAYADWYRFFADVIGNLAWGATQDWMCEPFMLGRFHTLPGTRKWIESVQKAPSPADIEKLPPQIRARAQHLEALRPQDPEVLADALEIVNAGLMDIGVPRQFWLEWNWYDMTFGQEVVLHQRMTIESFRQLHALDPGFVPILQGWQPVEYLRGAEMYKAAGFDLSNYPVVGIGSVCRRQATGLMNTAVSELASIYGIRLHGFGFKMDGLPPVWRHMASSDSMAWSFAGRKVVREQEKVTGKKPRDVDGVLLNNSVRFALVWRERLLAKLVTEAVRDETAEYGTRNRNDVDLVAWRKEMYLPPAEEVVEKTGQMREIDGLEVFDFAVD